MNRQQKKKRSLINRKQAADSGRVKGGSFIHNVVLVYPSADGNILQNHFSKTNADNILNSSIKM